MGLTIPDDLVQATGRSEVELKQAIAMRGCWPPLEHNG
jgi:hypothetical protein